MKKLLLFALPLFGFYSCAPAQVIGPSGVVSVGSAAAISPPGNGTVTSVSVTTANGVSGSVATATTTPAITLTLGAITPTTVNGNTLTTGTGTLTLGSGKTATISNTLTFTGTDGSALAIGSGGTLGTAAYTASTAYAPATSGSSILYGNGSGGTSSVTVGSGLTFSAGTLSANVTSVAGRTGAVILAQADIAGLTTASSPTFAGATLTGNLLFTDATYDIGAIGATRPRNGYFFGNLNVAGLSGNAAVNIAFGTNTGANLYGLSDLYGTYSLSSPGTEVIPYRAYSTLALGANNLTNWYGFNSTLASKTGAGTLTNAYAFYANSPTAAANNYAFYSSGSAPSVLGGNLTVGGKFPSINATATVGSGVPLLVANDRITAQSTNATIGTFTVPASDTTYAVSANLLVTAATAVSTSLNIAYTDESNSARTMILPVTGVGGTFLAGGLAVSTGPAESAVIHIRCKASTTITATVAAGTFTGVTYNAEWRLQQL